MLDTEVNRNEVDVAEPALKAPSEESGVDVTRRGFLKGLLATLALGTTSSVLSKIAEAQEGGLEDTDAVREELEAVATVLETSPESFDNASKIEWLICLNFLDAIVSLGKKQQPVLGFVVLKVLDKSGLNTHVGMKAHHVEYPTVSLAAGVLLNMWLAQQGEEHAHMVHHTFEEAFVGTSMMATAASLSNGIGVNERKHFAILAEEDKKRVEKARETVHRDDNEGNIEQQLSRIPGEIETLEAAMVDVIQMAPLAASLTQFPLFAAGNAAVTREKMTAILDLASEIGGLLAGKKVIDLKKALGYPTLEGRVSAMKKSREISLLANIKNPVIGGILVSLLSKYKGQDDLFTADDAEAFASAYTREVGMGMMSGTMDLAQTVVGDVGPALAAPLQSVGLEETCKTAKAHMLFAVLIAMEESVALESRMGVPKGTLLNPAYIKNAGAFALECWKNFALYLFNASGPGAVQYSLLKQLTEDVSSILGAALQGFTRLGRHGDAAAVDGVLFERALTEYTQLREVQHQLVAGEATGPEEANYSIKARNAALLLAGLDIKEENAVTGGSLAKALAEIEALVHQSETSLSEKQKTFLEKLNGISKLPTGENKAGRMFEEKRATIEGLLSRESGMTDLMDFEYWVAHLGPEIAETAFVVFLQGIHLSGLIPKLSKAYEHLPKGTTEVDENLALTGSFATTAAMSMVADNWAATLTSMKLIPKNIYVPLFTQKYKLTEAEMPAISDVDPPLVQLLKVVEAIEEKLDATGTGPNEYDDLYSEVGRAFAITKSVSILAGVLGGGETTIGNSPHFAMIVGKLKEIITLGASIMDVMNHLVHHGVRFGATLSYAVYAAPMIEMHLPGYKNPFKRENRDEHRAALDAGAESSAH